MTQSELASLLDSARTIYTQNELAKHLGVQPRTIRRWEKGEVNIRSSYGSAMRELLGLNHGVTDGMAANDSGFTFIDLFAGIGGIRRGFEAHGGRCVFTSEWDKFSVQTYKANFADEHDVIGDIRAVHEDAIPDHDLLLAGFPCQPFSLAGVSKKNSLGRAHGFQCDTQGTLFYDIARIIAAKQPAAFMLENVKNLVSHDKGNTFRIIRQTLEDELGYHIHYRVIDGQHFVPQHRERIIIVGFREKTDFTWDDLILPELDFAPRLVDILHPENGEEIAEEPYTTGSKAKVNSKYVLSLKLWKYLQAYKKKHEAKGNGFGFGLVTPEDVARTLSARYHKDGSEILVSRGKRRNPRRLTPRECARLMGFDTPDFQMKIPVSDTQAYRQFGNSVVVPVIQEVARIMTPRVMSLIEAETSSQISLAI